MVERKIKKFKDGTEGVFDNRLSPITQESKPLFPESISNVGLKNVGLG